MHHARLARAAVWPAVFGALAVAPLARLSAQAPAPPVFTVEFRAIATDGQPVRDLKPDEVTLRIDGRDRRILALDLVRFAEVAPPGDDPPPEPLPPPFATNTPPETGRDVLILLDDESFRPGRGQTVKGALTLLVDALSPHDRIGLRMLPLGGVNVPLTTGRRQIRSAIAGLTGRAPADPTETDLACRTRQNLAILKDVFAGVSPDAPMTIIFLSDGMITPDAEGPTVGQPSVLCEIRTVDFNEIEGSALAARAHFYVLQVLESVGFGAVSLNMLGAGLAHLAEMADGDVIRLGPGVPEAILRPLRETSAYYVATFEPEPSTADGRDHRLSVQIGREGVQGLARSRIVIPASADLAAAAKAGGVGAMLRGRPYQELPLRAGGYAARDRNLAVKVLTLFEPVDPSVTLTAAAVGLIDETGRLQGQWTATAGELQTLPVSAAIGVTRGTYRMRVAAIDTAGRRGTVDYVIQVDLPRAGPVRVSALGLGTPARGALQPRLLFGPEEVGVAYLEIYGVTEGTTVEVSFDLAASEDGPALATIPATVASSSADDLWIASGAFSAARLPAGDYLLRAVVSVDGAAAARLFRTLRKIEP